MKLRLGPIVACGAVAALLLPEPGRAEEYLLYQPKPATGAEVPASPEDGVLVKSVTIKRGDTLTRIARRHIGKGWLFPQVLLFNEIPNPNLIYAGQKVMVPVASGAAPEAAPTGKRHPGKKRRPVAAGKAVQAAKPAQQPAPAAAPARHPEPAEPAAKSATKAHAAKPAQTKGAPRPAQAHTALPSAVAPKPAEPQAPASRKEQRRKPAEPVEAAHAGAEQVLYQGAKQAYLEGKYREAADAFSSFLRKYPNSPLAADVALYRADCLLHLSE